MKKFLKPKCLPLFTLSLGVLGCLSMFWLHSTGVDNRELLSPLHPGAILAWILSAVAVAGVIVLSQPLMGKLRYDRIFPRSIVGAVGTGVSAIGIAVTAYGELTSKIDRIVSLSGIFGLAGAACLGYLAWCRFQQIRPHFLARCVVIIYMMMHLLCRYRVWSSEPELLRYGFDMAATVCLLLASYYRAAIETGNSERRAYLRLSLLGGFFAMLALPGSSDQAFLGGMAVWALTDLCSLRVRRQRPKQEET